MPLSRRHLLASGLVLSGTGVLAACSSESSSPLTIGLTYTPNIQFAPFYMAKKDSKYASGVSLRHHGAQEGLFDALLSGKEQLVVAGADEAVVAASNGSDLVVVGGYYQSYPACLIVPESSPIKTPADLKGKTVGTPGRKGETWYALQLAMDTASLSESDLTIQDIGYTQQAALVGGKVDAVVGFSNNDAVQMRLAGLQIREITLNPTSTPLVSASFITTHKWAHEHPEQARAVVAATTKAMNDIAAAPQIALDATKQWDTSLTDEATLSAANAVLAATVPLWLGDTGTATGAQDLATWAQMVTFLDSLGELEGSVDATTLATNDYVSANDSASPQS